MNTERIVLFRVFYSLDPVEPNKDEMEAFMSLTGQGLLGYLSGIKRSGYYVTDKGRDLISPHQQGDRV